MNIKEIVGLKNLFEVFLEDYMRDDKCLVLYGAGSYCEWVLRLLSRHKIVPLYIIDKRLRGG